MMVLMAMKQNFRVTVYRQSSVYNAKAILLPLQLSVCEDRASEEGKTNSDWSCRTDSLLDYASS